MFSKFNEGTIAVSMTLVMTTLFTCLLVYQLHLVNQIWDGDRRVKIAVWLINAPVLCLFPLRYWIPPNTAPELMLFLYVPSYIWLLCIVVTILCLVMLGLYFRWKTRPEKIPASPPQAAAEGEAAIAQTPGNASAPAVSAGPPASGWASLDLGRRQFLRKSAVGVISTSGTVFSAGAVRAQTRFVITRTDIPIAGLDPRLDGFRITQISDIHVGILMEGPRLDELVDVTLEAKGDIILMTGDILDFSVNYIPEAVRGFSRLKAPHGVWACVGNHDQYTGEEEVVEGLKPAGVQFLENRHKVLDVHGAPLVLAGISYLSRGNSHAYPYFLDTALKSLKVKAPVVMMAHSPDAWKYIWKYHVALTLSGHTHAGQAAIPFLGPSVFNMADVFYRFSAGHYEQDGMHLYVNRGAGLTGPPVRIACDPEVSVLVLRAKP